MGRDTVEWDEAAIRRLQSAPFFVRRIARGKVEKAAREQGVRRISVEFMEKIRKKEMGR